MVKHAQHALIAVSLFPVVGPLRFGITSPLTVFSVFLENLDGWSYSDVFCAVLASQPCIFFIFRPRTRLLSVSAFSVGKFGSFVLLPR